MQQSQEQEVEQEKHHKSHHPTSLGQITLELQILPDQMRSCLGFLKTPRPNPNLHLQRLKPSWLTPDHMQWVQREQFWQHSPSLERLQILESNWGLGPTRHPHSLPFQQERHEVPEPNYPMSRKPWSHRTG